MDIKEVIHLASEQGTAVGQASLSQYIIKEYGATLSPELTKFLEKVSQEAYDKIAKNIGEPSEDIALQVQNILAKYPH